MDNVEQEKWDRWAEAHIRIALERERDVFVDVFNGFRNQTDNAVTALRREIAELRSSPPLFATPDRKLNDTMVRVGEEIHAQKEGIDALRAATAECAKRSDLGGVRQRLESRIAELEVRGASVEKNLHALNGMIFNLTTTLKHMHALLARFAVATDCEHVLTLVDKNLLPPDEQKQPPPAVVISLPDLRFARSA
jgi:uncharacterized coiled-coil protein SlyX